MDGDRIAGFLACNRAEGWRLVIERSPAWLDAHPGGFGAPSLGEIRVNPDRLAERCAPFPDDQVVTTLACILVWWEWVIARPDVAIGPDATRAFLRDRPDDGACLEGWAATFGVRLAEVLVA